jgi:hypothetical protein
MSYGGGFDYGFAGDAGKFDIYHASLMHVDRLLFSQIKSQIKLF